MKLTNMDSALSSILYPLSVKDDCLMLALVQYPDSGKWLYFTLSEVADSGGECLAFPGDRDFYATAEDAVQAATDAYANLYRPFPLRNAAALYAAGCDPITAQYLATGELPG